MCDIHELPGAASPPAPEPRPVQAVQGWDCDSFSDIPPVIVNPEADAEGLMAWSLGQLSQVEVLLRVIGGGEGSSLGASDLANALRHFAGPAIEVLLLAQRQVRASERGAS